MHNLIYGQQDLIHKIKILINISLIRILIFCFLVPRTSLSSSLPCRVPVPFRRRCDRWPCVAGLWHSPYYKAQRNIVNKQMPVKRKITEPDGVYFITITCHQWLPLIEKTNGYDLVYRCPSDWSSGRGLII